MYCLDAAAARDRCRGCSGPRHEAEEVLLDATEREAGRRNACADRPMRAGGDRRRAGPRADRPQHHSVGSVRQRAAAARRRHAGEDVRRPDASLRPGLERGPDQVLQVRALRDRHRWPRDDRERPSPRGDDHPRQVQRAARPRHQLRRRRLGRRLDLGRGPRIAAAAGSLQRSRCRDRRAGVERPRPDRRTSELPAQRSDRGRGRKADRRAQGRRAGGPGRASRHRHLHLRDQRLPGHAQSLDRALDAQRHVRPQRPQGAVRGPRGRRRGTPFGVPRRPTATPRTVQGQERLRRPAPVQEPR